MRALMCAGGLLLSLLVASAMRPARGASRPSAAPATAPDDAFVGTWSAGRGTTTLIVAIQPAGKGTFLLIQNGSWGIYPFTWRDMPGGILVDGIPRLRFWKGRQPDEARVEMQPLLKEWTNAEMMQFPTSFFMTRAESGPGAKDPRPIPAGWDAATLPADWDASAGKPQNRP